jgi:hypothetical protein
LYTEASYGIHTIDGCLIRESGSHGVHVDSSGSADNGNALRITQTALFNNSGAGIRLESGNGYLVSGNDIESNGENGMDISGVGGISIIGNYIEDHSEGTLKAAIVVGTACAGVSILSNFIKVKENLGELYGIYVARSFSLAIIANTISGAVGSSGTGIYFTDEIHTSVSVINNNIEVLATRIKAPSGGFARYFASGASIGSGFGPVFNSLELESASPRLHFKETDQADNKDIVYLDMLGGALSVRNESNTTLFSIRPYDTNPSVVLGLQLLFKSYTTAARPTPYSTGVVIYDSTLAKLILYNGAAWVNIDGSSLSSVIDGSATFDPANLVDGAGETTTVTVTGAALGDFAEASFSNDLQGISLTAWVSASNTVSVRFQNESGGTLDLASGTLRARVRKA